MPFNRTEYLARAARKPRQLAQEALAQVELPSGATFTLTKPGIEAWVLSNRLPQGLVGESFRHFMQGKLTPAQITDSHIFALAQFRHDVIEMAMVLPRLVPDEVSCGDDELHYRDLGAEDADAIFAWATRAREVAQLGTFRDDRRVPAAGADGGEIRPATGLDDGPELPRRGRRARA